MTKDKMVGWHQRLNGHESEQALGDGEGQGSLACCSPWGHKELDTTEQLNNCLLTLGLRPGRCAPRAPTCHPNPFQPLGPAHSPVHSFTSLKHYT